jgi:hypothetical protein
MLATARLGHEDFYVLADHFGGGVTKHFFRRGIHGFDHAILADGHNPFHGRGQNRPQPRLTVRERGGGLFFAGPVLNGLAGLEQSNPGQQLRPRHFKIVGHVAKDLTIVQIPAAANRKP